MKTEVILYFQGVQFSSGVAIVMEEGNTSCTCMTPDQGDRVHECAPFFQPYCTTVHALSRNLIATFFPYTIRVGKGRGGGKDIISMILHADTSSMLL